MAGMYGGAGGGRPMPSSTTAGGGMGTPGGGKPKDLASAIEASEPEVEPDSDEELDPEQAQICQEGGFTPEQGKAIVRLIETMRM